MYEILRKVCAPMSVDEKILYKVFPQENSHHQHHHHYHYPSHSRALYLGINNDGALSKQKCFVQYVHRKKINEQFIFLSVHDVI